MKGRSLPEVQGGISLLLYNSHTDDRIHQGHRICHPIGDMNGGTIANYGAIVSPSLPNIASVHSSLPQQDISLPHCQSHSELLSAPEDLDSILRLHIVSQRHTLRLEPVPLVTRLEEPRTTVHGKACSLQCRAIGTIMQSVEMIGWKSACPMFSDGGAPGSRRSQ